MNANQLPAKTRAARFTAVLATAALALTGCAGTTENAQPSNTIDYWMWDTSQLPSYQKCAAGFEKANPDLKVKITQYGWDDYWSKLTASFIAGTGPDVFTNHVSQYPQFVSLDVLAPLDDFKDIQGVDQEAFQDGLKDLWTGPDGKQYGMPKDWDTIAMYYNQKILDEAGVDPKEISDSQFSPEGGGSFEKLVAHLSIDANGVRGDEPGFDKNHVKVYGLGLSNAGGDNAGQSQWAGFAATNGWQATDQPLWGTHYNYDDPKVQETLDWYFGLSDKGFMPRYGQFNSADGVLGQVTSGSVAMVSDGAWMNASYISSDTKIGAARLPKGPDGTSKSVINGLADSVVKSSDNQEGGARWVAYLASKQCQDVVAKAGVVFPSRTDATNITSKIYAQQGMDPTAFTGPVKDGNTFYLPVTDHGADVTSLIIPALEDLWANRQPASTLNGTNDVINNVFIK